MGETHISIRLSVLLFKPKNRTLCYVWPHAQAGVILQIHYVSLVRYSAFKYIITHRDIEERFRQPDDMQIPIVLLFL
jgi:hypothetical protein